MRRTDSGSRRTRSGSSFELCDEFCAEPNPSARRTGARVRAIGQRIGLSLGLSLCTLAAGCGQAEPEVGVTALWVLPGGPSETPDTDFFAQPFPSDLRLRPGTAGAPAGYDLTRLPRPLGQPGKYVESLDGQILGAGTGAAVYFRLAGALDQTSLPGRAAQTLDKDAPVQIVDITPGSPTFGQRAPVLLAFHTEGNKFIGPNWLTVQPVAGIPLREKTTYAAILTRRLRAVDDSVMPAVSRPLQPDLDLQALLAAEVPAGAAMQAAWQAYAPLRAFLDRGDGVTRDDVASATVFTTQDATSGMLALRAAVYEQPVPTAQNLAFLKSHDGLCDIYTGTFDSPNFQEGDPPYWEDGGAIRFGAGGKATPVRTEHLRFGLSVPSAPMPPAGWPVILYAHGTGGDYLTFMREQLDLRAGFVEVPGQKDPVRFAMLGIDQVLHGPRDPTGNNPELTFFNLRNLLAARDNVRQGAADDFQLLRLVETMQVASAPQTGQPIKFDPSKIYFVGHSQGGLTGPLFLAAEPKVKAGVLSGAGAVLILSLLNKKEPNDIAALVESLLMEPAGTDHPLLNLLQMYFEPADPNNYGPQLFRAPPPGMPPKSIFQTLGLVDNFTPVPNIAAFALSLGVQPMAPRLYDLPGLELTDLTWTDGPVQSNVAGGKATGVLREYAQAPNDDGHFVIFDLWAARHDWTRFLATHETTGVAVMAPQNAP